MAFVIAEPCRKNSNCVDVCPVDCIHPRRDEAQYAAEERSFIDPAACIDCGLCVPVCPVSAIFVMSDLPESWKQYSEVNAKHYETHGTAYKATARAAHHH